jgi:hypothetical protein
MKLIHLSLGLSLLLPLVAEAGEFWRFETEDGVVSFVDDAKKIPEKYREIAVRQETQGLESYARSTVSVAPPTRPAAAPNRPVPAPAPVPEPEWTPVVEMPVPDGGPVEREYTRTKEFQWVEGAFGAPGEVYALVEVVRDADGEVVSVELHDPDIAHVVSGR